MAKSPDYAVERCKAGHKILIPQIDKTGSLLQPNLRKLVISSSNCRPKETILGHHRALMLIMNHVCNVMCIVLAQNCCSSDGKLLRKEDLAENCLVVEIPEDDEFYKKFDQTCFAFLRSAAINDNGCKVSVRQQVIYCIPYSHCV